MKNRQGVAVLLGVLALGSILAMTTCGGGGGLAAGGTGGTGVGSVSGFGSVIVNGVEYDDAGIDNTNFFDGNGRSKSGLMTGMMVAIFGSINGSNGRADNITVLRHVDGPMDDNGVDLATNGLKVMGQDILVDTSTVFDNVASLAALGTLQGANVRHPELEVHGSADNNGAIHATFIHKWSDDRVAVRVIQVRGTVAGPPTPPTFVIGRQTVNFGGLPGGLPAGVIDGSFVEVKGSLRVSDNVLSATFVKLEDATGGQPSGGRAEVEGYVKRVVTPNASFELNGPNGVQTVTWTAGSTVFQGGTGADIAAGVKVEVEGTRKADKSLAATKIAIRRANNVRIENTVTGPTAVSLTLFGKEVKVNALTQYKDSRDNLKTFGQLDIRAGDTLKVSAFLDNTTAPVSIVATRVERIAALAADRRILQGPVDFFLPGGPDLLILGIDVLGAAVPAAFLNTDETTMTQADFFQVLADNLAAGKTTIVKARGTSSNPMSANEMQIEPTVDN
jgi:hypothetical protein